MAGLIGYHEVVLGGYPTVDGMEGEIQYGYTVSYSLHRDQMIKFDLMKSENRDANLASM